MELVGQVDMLNDKSASYDFFSITKDLEPPGSMFESKQYKFKFGAVDKQNETYCGINVRMRYFVRLVVIRTRVLVGGIIGGLFGVVSLSGCGCGLSTWCLGLGIVSTRC